MKCVTFHVRDCKEPIPDPAAGEPRLPRRAMICEVRPLVASCFWEMLFFSTRVARCEVTKGQVRSKGSYDMFACYFGGKISFASKRQDGAGRHGAGGGQASCWCCRRGPSVAAGRAGVCCNFALWRGSLACRRPMFCGIARASQAQFVQGCLRLLRSPVRAA